MIRPARARGLALAVAALTGCATAPAPRLLPADLQVGALAQRTQFEVDDTPAAAPAAERDAPDDRVDTPARKRRRKGLFFLGVGGAGLGALGVLGFGIGGRVVQAQVKNGYEDGTLTLDKRDSLDTTGSVMNGLAIGTAAVGLAGVILAATMYGIDHARCGDLPPRRKECPEPEAPADAEPQ